MTNSTLLRKPIRMGYNRNAGALDKKNDDHVMFFTLNEEDAEDKIYIGVVADGVTTTVGGEQASQIAIDKIQEFLKQPSTQPLLVRLREAVISANEAIWMRAQADTERRNMSTTLVLAAVTEKYLYVLHLGDSRAYLIRDGQSHQLTKDHTWVQEALDEGIITQEEAANHPNRHVLRRYLGINRTVTVDSTIIQPKTDVLAEDVLVDRITLQPGDAILLCSDGLTGKVTAAEIADTVATHGRRPQGAVDQLVDLALQRKEPDNITALLLSLPTAKKAIIKENVIKQPRGRSNLLTLAVVLCAALISLTYLYGMQSNALERPGIPQAIALEVGSPEQVNSIAKSANITGEKLGGEPTSSDPAVQRLAVVIAPGPEATEQRSNKSLLRLIQPLNANTGTRVELTPTANPTEPSQLIVQPTSTVRPTFTATAIPRPTITPTPSATSSQIETPVLAEEQEVKISVENSEGRAGESTKSVTLVLPSNDSALEARSSTFQWQVNNFELDSGEAFEVVAWELGQDPAQAKGLREIGRSTSVEIDVSILLQQQVLQTGRTYEWGVRLVDLSVANNPPRLIGRGHTFRVDGQSSQPKEEPTNTPEPEPTQEPEPTSESPELPPQRDQNTP